MELSLAGALWLLDANDLVGITGRSGASLKILAGRASGSNGCNRFNGTVDARADGTMRFGTLLTTLMACPPPHDELERIVMDRLARVARWRIDGERLLLLDEQGALLLGYSPASRSPVGTWSITGYLDAERQSFRTPVEGSEPTLSIAADGAVAGSTGCNRIMGSAEIVGSRLRFEPLATTRMACDEERMRQEQAVLAALGATTGWHSDERGIVLDDDDRQRLLTLAVVDD